MHLFIIAAVTASSLAASDKPMWCDPQSNSLNRLPARAISVPCESRELAIAVAMGYNAEGGSKDTVFSTKSYHLSVKRFKKRIYSYTFDNSFIGFL